MLKKIGTTTLLVSLSKIIGTGVSWVTLGLLTHSLGADLFGDYSTIFAYLFTLQALCDFGLHSILTRELAKSTTKEQKALLLREYLGVRVVLLGGVLVLGISVLFLFPYTTSIKIGVAIASLSVVLMSVAQMFLGVFQANITSYKYTIAELAGRLVHLGIVAVLVFVFTTTNLLVFVGAFVVSLVVFFGISFVFAQKEVPIAVSFPQEKIVPILRLVAPIGLSIIFTVMYFRADTIMLSVLKDSEAVGLYSISYKVFEILLFFPAMFFGLFLPLLSRTSQYKKYLFSNTMSFLANTAFVFVLPLVCGGVFIAGTIIYVIGGAEFLDATITLKVLFFALGVVVFGSLFGNAIIATNTQKKALVAYGAGFVFNVIANLIVIPRYSYEGAAYTTLATECIVTAILAYIIYKHTRFRLSLRVVVVSVGAVCAMGGFLSVFSSVSPNTLESIGIVLVGLLLYTSIVALLFSFFKTQYQTIGAHQ